MAGNGRRAKRDSANERLRVGFLGQAGPKLVEFRELLAGEPESDVRESVAFELTRMAETADSLHLEGLASMAAAAAEQIREGGDVAVLRSVATALRRAHGRALFAPVLIVAEGSLAERLQRQSEGVAEPVRVLPDAGSLFHGFNVERPGVLVLPARALDTVRRLAEDDFPILVYGDTNDWRTRLEAVEAGARAFLPGGFDLEAVLDLSRWYAVRDEEPVPEIFVLTEEGSERDTLVKALTNGGMSVVASASPSEIAPALDVVCPDALVIGARVADRDGTVLVRAVRGHVTCGEVPILVVGEGVPAEVLRAAGADDVLADPTPGEVVELLAARIRRFTGLARERDRLTGLPNRRAVLRSLDRHIANARRRGDVLSVSLVQIEGLDEVRTRWGKAAVNAAQRALAEQLEGGIRRVDIVGQLGADLFIAGLPSCRATDARRRMDEIRGRFVRRCRGDHRLKELGLAVGVADSEAATDRIVQRAERELLRARAGHA